MKYQFVNDPNLHLPTSGDNAFQTKRDGSLSLLGIKAIDLSGGTGGRGTETVYTTPNGVVVTSTIGAYNSSPNYWMEHMFDNTIQTANNQNDRMWLVGPVVEASLTFDFSLYTGYKGLKRIELFPKTRDDGRFKYIIEVSIDNIEWVQITEEFRSDHVLGYGNSVIHDVDIPETTKFFRISMKREQTYISVDEIRIFEESDTTNDYHTFNHSPLGNHSLVHKKINDINIDAVIPLNCDIKYLMTFDGGKNFYKYAPVGWESYFNRSEKAVGTIIVGSEYNTTTRSKENINNSELNYWMSTTTASDKWIGYQFESPKIINKIHLRQYTSYYTTNFAVEQSDDGLNWEVVYEGTQKYDREENNYISFPVTKSATHWRFRSTSGYPYMSAYEFYMYELLQFPFELANPLEIETVGDSTETLNLIPSTAFSNIEGSILNFAIAMKGFDNISLPKINYMDINSFFNSVDAVGMIGESETQIEFINIDNIFTDVTSEHRYDNVISTGMTTDAFVGGESETKINFVYLCSTMASVSAPVTRPIKTYDGIQYGVGMIETPPFEPRLYPKQYHPAIYNGQIKNNQPLIKVDRPLRKG
jgi:hypothetical protein